MYMYRSVGMKEPNLDGGQKVVRRVVAPLLHSCEPLRVGSPEHDHLVERIGRLEVTDVTPHRF
jgi:hypothetical protein